MALGELQVTWVGSDEGEVLATNEFDIQPEMQNETEEGENV
jgi:segregation and condensation protein A